MQLWKLDRLIRCSWRNCYQIISNKIQFNFLDLNNFFQIFVDLCSSQIYEKVIPFVLFVCCLFHLNNNFADFRFKVFCMYFQCNNVWYVLLFNVSPSFGNSNLIQPRNHCRTRSKLYVVGSLGRRCFSNIDRVHDGLVRKWHAFLFDVRLWNYIFGFNSCFEKFVWKIIIIRGIEPRIGNEGSKKIGMK